MTTPSSYPTAAPPVPGPLPGAPAAPATAGATDAAWRRPWPVTLLACALAIGLRAGLAPLADPDLPMHLLVGEWIAAHRAVPFVEPFAWTRTGEPYYAYSWLAQLAFHFLFRVAGPAGLHLLGAAAGIVIVLATAAAGRALGARPAAATLLGAAGGVLAVASTPFVRPQLLMHALVPLAWLCAARLRDGRSRRRWLLALLVVSAVAAGTHITFPVIAAPLALFLLPGRRPGDAPSAASPAASPDASAMRTATARGALLALAAVVGGWLLSPYALAWPAVFRLNLGANVLLAPPSPVGEMEPGFLNAPLAGLALAALPLLAAPALRAWRERVVLGALWLAGLLVFARMQKGLGPWWWCALPMAVLALRALPRPSSEGVRRLCAALLAVVLLAPAIGDARLLTALGPLERADAPRSLPSLKAYAAEPAALWLERRLRPAARGRLLTTFAYGSYLAWRLPTLSGSSDSRTIFPDSAALPDALTRAGATALGPWRSADVAIVPVTYPVAAVLDTARGWRRVGVAEAAPWAPAAARAGLWVREAWWAAAGRAPLPDATPDTLRVMARDSVASGTGR